MMQSDQTLDTPLFLNAEQPLADRVADLVARMTLEEKLG